MPDLDAFNEKQIPPGAEREEVQREIARIVFDRWNAAKTSVSQLDTSIWAKNEQIYEGKHQPPPPFDGCQTFPVHFAKPRISRMRAELAAVLTKQNPLFSCDDSDPDRKTRRQKAMTKLLNNAGYDAKITLTATHAANTNKGVLLCRMGGTPRDLLHTDVAAGSQVTGQGEWRYMGLDLHAVHPRTFHIFPALPLGIADSQQVGHDVTRSMRRVRELIKMDYFLPVEDSVQEGLPNDPRSNMMTGMTRLQIVNSSVEGDRPVNITDCYTRLPIKVTDTGYKIDLEKGEREKWFHVMLLTDSQTLLDIEPWDYSRPPYFEFGLIPDSVFWSEQSLTRDLMPYHLLYNMYRVVLYNGAMREFAAPVYGKSLEEKTKIVPAGAHIDVERPDQLWSPTIRFQSAAEIYQDLLRIGEEGDMVARVSRTALGAVGNAGETATKTNQIAGSVSVGIDDFISQFSLEFPAMCTFVEELMLSYFDILKEAHPYLEITAEDLQVPTCWEPVGKTSSQTPQAQMQGAQMLAEYGAAHPEAGFDFYELGTVIKGLVNVNADNIQMPKQEAADQSAAKMLQAMQGNIGELVQNALQSFIARTVSGNVTGEDGQPGEGVSESGQPGGSELPALGNGASPEDLSGLLAAHHLLTNGVAGRSEP